MYGLLSVPVPVILMLVPADILVSELYIPE